MSIMVTMRPRRLRRPAMSGAASGTRVNRSGTNTSCTRKIGNPKSWPPMIAVTYSTTFSFVAVMIGPSCRAAHIGGLLLERRDQALAVELGHIVVQADLLAALDRLGGDERRETDDRHVGGARGAAPRPGGLQTGPAGHHQIRGGYAAAPAARAQRR